NKLNTKKISQNDIDRLTCDPPLPLFILLEAGLDLDPRLQGRCMGVLGSIILAEVLGKRLAAERARLDMLKAACKAALPDVWDRIEGIDTMPKLVNFVAEFAGLNGCADTPFI